MKIPLTQAELVPIAAKVSSERIFVSCYYITSCLLFPFKLGFEFHHAHSGYVMMTQWLPVNEESTLPLYATHNIGKLVNHIRILIIRGILGGNGLSN